MYEYNMCGTKSTAFDVGRKWQSNMSAEKVSDAKVLFDMIEIRDGFKSCEVLNSDEVQNIIDQLTVF